MTIDMRRELRRIHTEFDRQTNVIGEVVLWFRLDPASSEYHSVYDSWASRVFYPPISITVMWDDQVEDPEQYTDTGRRPTQRLRFAVSSRTLDENGIPVDEAHGGRVYDNDAVESEGVGRPESQIRFDRLNDVVYFDGRFYGISNFQIRGRAGHADALVGVTAIELQPDDLATSVFPTFGDV